MAGSLGRRVPTDFRHVELYPLSALPRKDEPTRVPVVLGVNWYVEFDRPVEDKKTGRFWVLDNLSQVRGGHCVCVPADPHRDRASWWRFYDQGREGACVGFGCSRAMTNLNRRRYYARWLWDQAKLIDEWPETKPGDNQGTSVRAAMEVLRDRGHVHWRGSFQTDDVPTRDARSASSQDGISAYRWAAGVDDVHRVLANPLYDRLGGVPIVNSWGPSYPHYVWMPDAVLERLIKEEGEVAIPTDR
jgi:hypothetical protein